MPALSERTLDEKLAAIADYFGLGQVHSFERAPGSNQNFLVTTTEGDYLFKIIVNTTLEDVLNGLPFLQRLEAWQFEAATCYLQSPAGSVFYSSPDWDAVVMRGLPGTMPQLSVAVNREVGLHLAQLHLIPCDGLPENTNWRILMQPSNTWASPSLSGPCSCGSSIIPIRR